MDRVKLQVRPREGRGSKDAKALRAAGDIPGVIYSATTDTQAIVVNARALRQAVSGGLHTILDVTLDGDGQTRPVLIKDLQLDPVRGRVVHIDLHEIRLDQVIQTVIPVHLEGHAEGVNMGGALNQPVHELHVDALPADLVDFISVDVSALEIGQSIRLSDLEAPPGVTFTDDLESTVIATIAAPVSEDELKTEAELEAEAEAEAEAAAAAEAAAEAGEEGAEPGEGGEEAGGGESSGEDSE
jgi:large subunit ribosomal protein L25